MEIRIRYSVKMYPINAFINTFWGTFYQHIIMIMNTLRVNTFIKYL